MAAQLTTPAGHPREIPNGPDSTEELQQRAPPQHEATALAKLTARVERFRGQMLCVTRVVEPGDDVFRSFIPISRRPLRSLVDRSDSKVCVPSAGSTQRQGALTSTVKPHGRPFRRGCMPASEWER